MEFRLRMNYVCMLLEVKFQKCPLLDVEFQFNRIGSHFQDLV